MTYLTVKTSIISTNNVSTSNLAGTATYTGTGESVFEYQSITINILASHDSSDGGIVIQFGQSTSNWDITITDTYTTANGNYSKNFYRQAPYFRVTYTNGSTLQTTFRIQCILNINDSGKDLTTFPDPYFDAFARLRVSYPYTLFQSSHNVDLRNYAIASKTTNNGTQTHITNESAVDLVTTADSGSQVIRQSRPYIVYQPGKSLLIMCSGVLNANTNGNDCNTKIGFFDDRNGVFFSYKNGLYVNLRSYITGSVVDTSIAKTSWNLDAMDGTGKSGIILDATKANIYVFDIEWLGVGRVRIGVMIRGQFHYVHTFLNGNLNDTTYMTRASLPIRYQIDNDATTNGVGTLKMICMTAISEGGYESLGYPFCSGLVDGQEISVGTTIKPLISIRLRSGDYTYKRVLSRFNACEIMSTSSSNMTYIIYHFLSPSSSPLTGGTWANADGNSAMEVNKTATAINTTGGTIMFQGYFSNNTDFSSTRLDRTVDITSDIDGNSDYIVLAAQKISVGTDDVLGSIQWSEYTT